MNDILTPITFTIGAFGQFLPPFHEVAATSPEDNEMWERLRRGEMVAFGVCITVGAVASGVSKSPAPMYAAALASVALVVLYESAAIRKAIAS